MIRNTMGHAQMDKMNMNKVYPGEFEEEEGN